MNEVLWDIEIRLLIPSTQLVYFPDEDKDDYFENKAFKAIRDCLGIKIHIEDWYNRCLQISIGEKHLQRIELYYSPDENSYILLDNHADPYDQIGLVGLGIKTTAELGGQLRKLTRKLNDESNYNIHYCEGSNAVFKLYPIDEKTKEKYMEIQHSSYLEGKLIQLIKAENQ